MGTKPNLPISAVDVELGGSPRVYLATIEELACALKKARNGCGDTVLREQYTYQSGVAANSTDEIPAYWRFSRDRVEECSKQKAIS